MDRIVKFFTLSKKEIDIKSQSESFLNLPRILFTAILLVSVLWALTFIVYFSVSDPNELGDSFGLVNSLFTALAFAFLIYTSLLQTQELNLQRKEIAENRTQLAESARAHRELVNLTRQINRDKIKPYLELEEFYFNTNQNYVLGFLVKGAAIKIESITPKFAPVKSFQYSPPNFQGFVQPEASTGKYLIPEKCVEDNRNQLAITFSTTEDRAFVQYLIIENYYGHLGMPQEIDNSLESSLM